MWLFHHRHVPTELADTGAVSLPSVETSSASFKEVESTKGKESSTSNPVMAKPILVSDDIKDEASGTCYIRC
jgi:hypothetical protein